MAIGNNNLEEELRLEPTAPDFSKEYRSVKGKRFLIIGACVIGFALVIYLLTSLIKTDSVVKTEPKVKAEVKSSVSGDYLYDMQEVVTNLSPTSDKESWIKLSLTLQLNNGKDQSVVDQKLPMIKDSIIIFLRELRGTDLASSGGSLMLKTELMKRINKILYPVELKDILFREILLNQ